VPWWLTNNTDSVLNNVLDCATKRKSQSMVSCLMYW